MVEIMRDIAQVRKENFRKRILFYKKRNEHDYLLKSYHLFNLGLDIVAYEFLCDEYNFKAIETIYGIPVLIAEKDKIEYCVLCDIRLNYEPLLGCDSKTYFTAPKRELLYTFIGQTLTNGRKPLICEINMFTTFGIIKKTPLTIRHTISPFGRLYYTIDSNRLLNEKASVIA